MKKSESSALLVTGFSLIIAQTIDTVLYSGFEDYVDAVFRFIKLDFEQVCYDIVMAAAYFLAGLIGVVLIIVALIHKKRGKHVRLYKVDRLTKRKDRNRMILGCVLGFFIYYTVQVYQYCEAPPSILLNALITMACYGVASLFRRSKIARKIIFVLLCVTVYSVVFSIILGKTYLKEIYDEACQEGWHDGYEQGVRRSYADGFFSEVNGFIFENSPVTYDDLNTSTEWYIWHINYGFNDNSTFPVQAYLRRKHEKIDEWDAAYSAGETDMSFQEWWDYQTYLTMVDVGYTSLPYDKWIYIWRDLSG